MRTLGWLFLCLCLACGRGGNGDNLDGGSDGDNPFGNGEGGTIASITVEPPNAAITIVNDLVVTAQFKAVAHYGDGSMKDLLTDVKWFATNPQIGAIDATGLYTPTTDIGGVVQIRADYMGLKGVGTLTVKLQYLRNPAMLGSNEQNLLRNASTPDASCVWAYPYDKTVFPRGLGGAPLEWFGGAAPDVYRVHIDTPTYEHETFEKLPPPSRYIWAPTDWRKLTDSTSGAAKMDVERLSGMVATVVAAHTWTIAPSSMRGTIYYWANDRGRVMRIKPGATAPDDFAYKPPLSDGNQYVQSSCLMTCHTVSADGSTLISGGGTFGGSYDLKTDTVRHYTGGNWGGNGSYWQSIQWANPAVSPDGKYILVNSQSVKLASQAQFPTNANFRGLYDTTSGAIVANSGLDMTDTMSPAWSPTGKKIVYVASGNPAGWPGWDQVAPGDLRAVDFDAQKTPMAGNDQLVMAYGGNAALKPFWPTIGPDGDLVLYQRGDTSRTDGTAIANMYASRISQPGAEVALDQLNGKTYPFAAGARDRDMNYEPAYAPVAAGGYFWVVFTSRRTYGNEMTGARGAVKQLWVAAIDQNAKMGDPSHPAFRLPGQGASSINMRGYWALDPCKGDGQGCSSGTECCGGYCNMAPMDAGGPICAPSVNGCANNGDKCNVDSDCCGVASGVTCINHVCSEPPPK